MASWTATATLDATLLALGTLKPSGNSRYHILLSRRHGPLFALFSQFIKLGIRRGEHHVDHEKAWRFGVFAACVVPLRVLYIYTTIVGHT